MNLTMDEFMRLADDKSQQAMRIAELERQLAVKTSENTRLTETVKVLEAANMAAKLENVHTRTDPVCTQRPYLTTWFEPLAARVLELCTRDFRPQRCVKQGVFGLKHVFARL